MFYLHQISQQYQLPIISLNLSNKPMSRQSQLDIFQSFIEKEDLRSKIAIGGEIQAIFDYCEYIIHTEYDKRSKTKYKSKDRKKQISQDFMRAYETLERTDKIMYYIKNVIYLTRLSNGNMKMPKTRTDIMEATAYTMSYSLRRWKQKKMRLDNSRQLLFGENQDAIKQYDLNEYIFRGSKNNKYFTFVLQAIKETVHTKNKTVHIGFQSVQVMKEWAEAVQLCIDYRHWQRIYFELFKKQPPKDTVASSTIKSEKQQRMTEPIEQTKQMKIEVEEKKIPSSLPTGPTKNEEILQFQPASDEEQQKKLPELDKQRTITQDLVEQVVSYSIENIERRNVQQTQNKSIKNLNIFHKMFPQFEFSEVEWQGNYEMIHNDNGIRIIQNSIEKQRCKIVMQFQESSCSCQQIFKVICGPDLTKAQNENIQEVQAKTFISSENAAIMYMVLKPFNRIYRPRDFLFIRHCFRIGPNAFYVADKDIENSNYPPFMTIVRGKYEAVWAVLKKQNNKIKVVGNILMDNSGYLTDDQNTNLTLNYLKNYKKLREFIPSNKPKIAQYVMFDLNWDITKNEQNKKQNEIRIQRISQKIKINKVAQSPSLIKLDKPNQQKVEVEISKSPKTKPNQKQKQLEIERQKMNMQQVEGEIDPKQVNHQLQTLCNIKLNFDEKGMVIISKGFIKAKYQLVPTKNYPSLCWESPIPGTHPLWMDDWRHDAKKGGLLFINNKKIEDQKGVLKFILSKIGKNLLAGKSVLNISLPVDIFVGKSNLELFIQSLSYAPYLLQKVVLADPLQKFKTATAFGISLSPLYLIMQKPFNPILGQTFQAWINGCPAYAQQISHHPPICSLLFYGRGYTLSGQFQSKAEVSVNSGTGTNDGIMRITFDDGTKICYCSAGGEVSGLTYGERKFNIQGKGYCWSQTQNYFVEIAYNPARKGFFSMKKQEQPEDYFEGDAVKVTPEFIASLYKKRRVPTQKEIVSTLGKFNGVWHQSTFFESEELLDITKQLPLKLQYEKNPLPSDANWREDIAYRRMMQVPRAQTEKQRLEVLQRNDRKLRQKRK